MLNLLVYLNQNWDENWGGAIELWDQKMQNNFLKIYPKINHAVIFRTDTDLTMDFLIQLNVQQMLEENH